MLHWKGFGGLYCLQLSLQGLFGSRKRYLYEGIEGWEVVAWLANMLASFFPENFNLQSLCASLVVLTTCINAKKLCKD